MKNIKAIHAFEMLDEIEAAKDGSKKELLTKYGAALPLNMLLSLNFDDTVALDLPEGMPPMRKKDLDTSAHPDSFGQLSGSIHKLKYCLPNSNLNRIKKESMFYDVITSCPLKDSEIVCAAKDSELEELYPSITKELVQDVFPLYVNDVPLSIPDEE